MRTKIPIRLHRRLLLRGCPLTADENRLYRSGPKSYEEYLRYQEIYYRKLQNVQNYAVMTKEAFESFQR